jgi:hypothetical protein
LAGHAKEGTMQALTLCLLFLAGTLFLAPGVALSRQSGIFRKIAVTRMPKHPGADRAQRPIPRTVNTVSTISTIHIAQTNTSQHQFSTAMAAFAIVLAASKNRGRPEASQ